MRRNAVAIVALLFAMTGTGIAASRYIITSTSQIKPSVLGQLTRAHAARTAHGDPSALPLIHERRNRLNVLEGGEVTVEAQCHEGEEAVGGRLSPEHPAIKNGPASNLTFVSGESGAGDRGWEATVRGEGYFAVIAYCIEANFESAGAIPK